MRIQTQALSIVSSQRNSYCTQCETDFCTTFEHRDYPGMKVCFDCLEKHGVDSRDLTNPKAQEAWDSIAKSQGRSLRIKRGKNKD